MSQSTPGPSRQRSSYFGPIPPVSSSQNVHLSPAFHSPLNHGSLSSPIAALLGSTSFPPSIPISAAPSARRRPVRKKRINIKLVNAILYQSTFWFFILAIAALLVGSVWGLGDQAWKTGDARRWNIFILVAAYVALGISAIAHLWSRLLSIKKILRTMPKPYMPTKQIDVPKRVADHIMTQYSRTAVVAHISQATKGEQEGWGRPGSKWENQHFRTYILNTLPTMVQALAPTSTAAPLSLEPLFEAADRAGDSGAIRLFVNSYAKLINSARFAGQEPTENDAVACDKIVDVVLLTLEMRRRRETLRRDDGGMGDQGDLGSVSGSGMDDI